MLYGFGQYSDLSVSAGSKILWLNILFAVKWRITEIPLASIKTYRIRKKLELTV